MLVPVPITISEFELESYIIGSEFIKSWSLLNLTVDTGFPGTIVDIPPPEVVGFASKNSSLNLVPTTGSSMHPDPFPPVTPIEIILSISKTWVSVNTSSIFPLTTGWTKAVIPTPEEMDIIGGLITSKFSPSFKTLTSVRGPKNILSSDL